MLLSTQMVPQGLVFQLAFTPCHLRPFVCLDRAGGCYHFTQFVHTLFFIFFSLNCFGFLKIVFIWGGHKIYYKESLMIILNLIVISLAPEKKYCWKILFSCEWSLFSKFDQWIGCVIGQLGTLCTKENVHMKKNCYEIFNHIERCKV